MEFCRSRPAGDEATNMESIRARSAVPDADDDSDDGVDDVLGMRRAAGIEPEARDTTQKGGRNEMTPQPPGAGRPRPLASSSGASRRERAEQAARQ